MANLPSAPANSPVTASDPRPAWGSWRARLQRDWVAQLALALLGGLLLAVLVGPWLYPASPVEIDFSQALLPPGSGHPLGTNDLGQDQLARLLLGGRISLAVGVMAMAIALSLGVLVGMLAGFYGGWLDGGLMRLTDLFWRCRSCR